MKNEKVKSTTKQDKEKIKEATAKGPTLACFFGLHAWVNGVCINCGKKKK